VRGRSLKKTVLVWGALWTAAIGALHAALNLDLFRRNPSAATQFRVGFLPVT
jgi:hypothetical protein